MAPSPRSKKMLATSEEELATILREADRIRSGDNPATVTAERAGEGPANHAGEPEGDAVPRTAAPSIHQLAELACLLCDWPCVRAFGATGQLVEPFRTEARKAWADVFTQYLPSIVAKAGPFGVLFSIYAMHAAGLYLAWQTTVPVSASSANEAPASQP